MLAMRTGSLATVGAALIALSAPVVNAANISIQSLGDDGYTSDGVYILSGTIQGEGEHGGAGKPLDPFQRTKTGTSGYQSGYNSDASTSDLNFDSQDEDGLNYVHSVQLMDMGTIQVDGEDNYVLFFDANEPIGGGGGIDITNIEVYVGSNVSFMNPELNGGLAGLGDAAWSLDNDLNGDMTIAVNSAICDAPGLCAAGHGDIAVLIPTALVGGSQEDYFVLFTEYAAASKLGSDFVGLEEWRHVKAVPEPTSALVFALGLGVVGSRVRRERSA